VFETICFGTSYNFNGNILNASGTYVDNLTAVAGCDSVVTLNLTVSPQINTSFSQTICAGTSYTHGTQTLNASGVYPEMFTSVDGCDSISTLYLFVSPVIENNIGASICQGQTYLLGSQNLSVTGEYTEMFTTAAGCDSLVRVFLNVTDVITTQQTAEICLGESYVLGTQTLTVSGQYAELFTTASGCDSLVTLDLVVQDCVGLIEISNICTPNGDGKNDTWLISDPLLIANCKVLISNRWGQTVYETSNYLNEWNGTSDGQQLPDGTYYYVITCDDDRLYQGSISLMRLKK
jgi:gliding motility-associated-like protein